MTTELETVIVDGVKLDIHFNYSSEFGFEIQSVEDITGVQDLRPLLTDWIMDSIENKLYSLYESRGWL